MKNFSQMSVKLLNSHFRASSLNIPYSRDLKQAMESSSKQLLPHRYGFTFLSLVQYVILGFLMIPFSHQICSSELTGSDHTCTLTSTQDVKCWGEGLYGKLGYGDVNYRGDASSEMADYLPFVNLDGENVVGVFLGADHSCVILSTNDLKCWGRNSVGQLGIGDSAYRGDAPNEMGEYLISVSIGEAVTIFSNHGNHNMAATTSQQLSMGWEQSWSTWLW